MAVYAIADLHLSLGANKPMDIFSGWENYVEKISNNFAALLHDDDTLILSGDLSWGPSLEEALPDFEFLCKYPGRKIILKGNHDYFWTTRSKMETFFEKYSLSIEILHNNCIPVEGHAVCGTRGWINDGSEPADQKIISREAARLETSIRAALETGLPPLCFLHYPPVYKQSFCKEIMDVLQKYGMKSCYYGHIHGKGKKWAVTGPYKGIEFHMISADYLDFMPIQVV